jgi:hypothetical protein
MAERSPLEQAEWLASQRQAASELHPQNQVLDAYERVRDATRQRGDRAEPVERGTVFTVVGRKLRDDER